MEPTPSHKGDAENAAYAAWLEAQDNVTARDILLALLRAHATSVCYLVLRRSEVGIIDTAVNNLWRKIGQFGGDSLFSTWAHRVLLNEIYMQRRRDAKSKEDPLEPKVEQGLFDSSTPGYVDLILSIEKVCTQDELQLFRRLYINGESTYEAAMGLGITQTEAWRRGAKLQRKLRHALA